MSSDEIITVSSGGLPPAVKKGLRPGLALLIITAAAALVLTLVNALTAGPIAARQEEARYTAMASVMPGADVFSELYSRDETIERISGAYTGTAFLGYCVEVSAKGFGGEISLMVGVDDGGRITGVAILDHSETPRLGANAAQPEFLDQYTGKSGTITVNGGRNSIDAVSGATITSQAVTDGVNTALSAVIRYIAEGGQIPDDGTV